ncbi:hypothetical protein BD410DRAFT_454973 [Rickenella mellea]|uniref:Uncharacterized protein n=1 Tax=Rickenella mellea TaxID=50990 RepID=A0A4Y7PW99_9AGAM|nr:hypothetical protein BD410DRAFT_454973 [Rickenella mellea]
MHPYPIRISSIHSAFALGVVSASRIPFSHRSTSRPIPTPPCKPPISPRSRRVYYSSVKSRIYKKGKLPQLRWIRVISQTWEFTIRRLRMRNAQSMMATQPSFMRCYKFGGELLVCYSTASWSTCHTSCRHISIS